MPRPAHRPLLRHAAIVGGLLAAVSFLGSCNIVAPVGYIIHGPEKVPAMHTLDPKKVTIVFIDDTRNSVLPSRAVRRKIAESAEKILLNDAKIERMKSYQDVMSIADREKFSKELGIAELGEAAGAEVVVYATMQSFAIIQEGENFTPRASASVRVVDVATKKQLWPDTMSSGYVLTVNAPPRTGGLPTSSGERNRVYAEFGERIGRAIGNVFVRHLETPETGLLDH